MDGSSELLKVFAVEASDWIDGMESSLLDFEEEPSRNDCLAELMRLAHTLKGSAGIAGLVLLPQVAHALEGVLEAVRQGSLRLGPDVFDQLARVLDALARGIRRVEREGIEPPDLSTTLQRVTRWRDAIGDVVATPQRVSSGLRLALGEYDEIRIGMLQEQGVPLLVAAVPLSDAVGALELWAPRLVVALRQVGTVVTTDPPASAYDRLAEHTTFHVLLGSKRPIEAIEAQLAAVGSSSARVTRWSRAASGRQAPTPAPAIFAERSLRVPLAALDDLLRLAGEVALCRDALRRGQQHLREALGGDDLARAIGGRVEQLAELCARLQDGVMTARMVPMDRVARAVKREVRAVGREQRRRVTLSVDLDEREIDASVGRELIAPMARVARALAEETARSSEGAIELRLDARQLGGRLWLTLAGLGRVPDEIRNPLRERISALGGRLERGAAESEGAVVLSLPLTRAIVQALVLRVGDELFAFPLDAVRETLAIRRRAVETVAGVRTIDVRGQALSLVLLEELLGVSAAEPPDPCPVVVLEVAGQVIAVAAHTLLGARDLVKKTLQSRIPSPSFVDGWAVVEEDLALLVNAEALLEVALATADQDARRASQAEGRVA